MVKVNNKLRTSRGCTTLYCDFRDVNKWIILGGRGRLKIPTLLEKIFLSTGLSTEPTKLVFETSLLPDFCIKTSILLVIISLKHKSTKEDKGNL